MATLTRAAAAMQVLLIFPAVLFLGAVFVGIGDPPQYELAHMARRIVAWYAGHAWTLWCLLLALPLAVAAAGCATLLRSWKGNLEMLVVAGTTFMSAGIFVVVVLHMLAN